jgi:hypothetical protein
MRILFDFNKINALRVFIKTRRANVSAVPPAFARLPAPYSAVTPRTRFRLPLPYRKLNGTAPK